MHVTLEDLLTAARTVWGEARGETHAGRVAVAHVIVNRARHGGRDHTLAAACLRQWQFSCWLEGDPNRDKLLRLGVDDALLRDCLAAVLEALDAQVDPTFGARHYHVTDMAKPPGWAAGVTPVAVIGHHSFFAGVA